MGSKNTSRAESFTHPNMMQLLSCNMHLSSCGKPGQGRINKHVGPWAGASFGALSTKKKTILVQINK